MSDSAILFDRTRRETYEKCPRKRWWAFEYNARGIVPVGNGRDEWALMTGVGTHAGVAALALGSPVDAAVAIGVSQSGYVALQPPSDDLEAFGRMEQLALVEALVRAWHLTQYQDFHDRYEVLGVEREEQLELGQDVVMMVRPDMVVRRRSDGAVFTWQLKTTKRADEKWASQWAIDQMTLSEPLAVEARTGEKLSGVIVQGLQKGDKSEWPEGSGKWMSNSPLITAWKNLSGKTHPKGEWSATWKWSDEEGNHTLGKGWRKVAVWDQFPGGTAAWVERLSQDNPALLSEQIVTLPPILRHEREQQAWQRAVVASERNIRTAREWQLKRPNEALLDATFPMHTSAGNCIWSYKCHYFSLCHEGAGPSGDQWKPRVPHHAQELVQIEGAK